MKKEITKDLIWELIKRFNCRHEDYGTVVVFLARFAEELTPSPQGEEKK
jgi:hypothetical protein